VGASTTDQVFQSFPSTWYGLTEARANQELGLQVEFGGFGAGGNTSPQLLGWLRQNLDAVQPDILITLEGINDLVWRGGPEYHYEGTPHTAPYDGPANSGTELGRCWKILQAQLESRRALRDGKALEWHSSNLPRIRADRQHLPHRDSLNRKEDPIVEFGDSMEAILTLADQRGIPVLVLGQPVLWKPHMPPQEEELLWFRIASAEGPVCVEPGVLYTEMCRYNQVQQKCAEKHGARYLDLDSSIPKTPEYYIDDCHYTDVGSQKVSDSIFPAVKELLLQVSRKHGG
jgi:hypothetical protein